MDDTATEIVTSQAGDPSDEARAEKICNHCQATFGLNDDRRYGWCRLCRLADTPEEKADAKPAEMDLATMHAMHIELGPDDEAKVEQKHAYWCGIVPGAPIHRAVLASITFSRDQGLLAPKGQSGKYIMVDHVKRGQVHNLTLTHVELVLERAKLSVVRQFGNGRGSIVTKAGSHSRPYRPRPNDVPLGKYLYMVRLGEDMPRDWRESSPPPMVQ
jgi:hypothetical protein